jgi:hypothetical protein
MCSIPKGSGTTCQIRRYIDDGADYSSYSKMLRKASDRVDQLQRKARSERQADADDDTGVMPEAIAPKSSSRQVSEVQQQPSHRSLVSRLLSYLD